MKVVSFALEEGNKYFGKIDGARFFIGMRVPYDGGKGLFNLQGTPQQRYDRTLFKAEYGFWADFIHPTAMAEGALYHTLNTYDRARFTFTFLQYAAHVPNGDFVLFLRALLQLPLAREYFPDLLVQGNRVCRMSDDGAVIPLESNDSTAGLLDYLNPSLKEIEDTEIIQAAKFVHWAENDPAHRRTQIDVGIAHFKERMAQYAARYSLDGRDDVTCLLVADIRHQGRATSPTIIAALTGPNPIEALLQIGAAQYASRIKVLRREIKALVDDGSLGRRKYSTAHHDFVLMAAG